MKKFLKKSLAAVLALVMLLSTGVPAMFAQAKSYSKYNKYVLLGDSIAAGHRDDKSIKSEFRRVNDSYGAYVADALGAKLVPLACPGFRTVELRYMVDDSAPTDEYMFHNMHTMTAEEFTAKRPKMRNDIASADLITIGIGGNDFVTSLKWVVADEFEKDGIFASFVKKIRESMGKGDDANESLDDFLALANKMKALPALSVLLPTAMAKGIQNVKNNWAPIIESIYKLNPDVELIVLNIPDVSVKDQHDSDLREIDLFKNNIVTGFLDLVNKTFRDGAKKYGYTYVNTNGAIMDDTHPTTEGHKFIAQKILDVLPNADVPFTDVKAGTDAYNAIAKVYTSGVMAGESEKKFNPDGAMTRSALAQALYNLAGKPEFNVETAFADVNSSSPAYTAIAWANSKGILKADKKGNFNPNGEVSYYDLYNAVVKAGNSTNKFGGKLSKFKSNYGVSLPQTISRAQAAIRLAYLV